MEGVPATKEVKEADIDPLFVLPGITLDLPLLGKIYFRPPEDKESIWEAGSRCVSITPLIHLFW